MIVVLRWLLALLLCSALIVGLLFEITCLTHFILQIGRVLIHAQLVEISNWAIWGATVFFLWWVYNIQDFSLISTFRQMIFILRRFKSACWQAIIWFKIVFLKELPLLLLLLSFSWLLTIFFTKFFKIGFIPITLQFFRIVDLLWLNPLEYWILLLPSRWHCLGQLPNCELRNLINIINIVIITIFILVVNANIVWRLMYILTQISIAWLLLLYWSVGWVIVISIFIKWFHVWRHVAECRQIDIQIRSRFDWAHTDLVNVIVFIHLIDSIIYKEYCDGITSIYRFENSSCF